MTRGLHQNTLSRTHRQHEVKMIRSLLITTVSVVLIQVFKTQAETAEIFLQKNSKGMIPCRMEKPYRQCSWTKNRFHLSTMESSLPGYSIQRNNNSECNLTISVVRANDSGAWVCNMPGNQKKQINVIAGVTPSNYFLYNNKNIPSDESKRNKVIPHPQTGEVEVKCVSYHANPAPSSIRWRINNRDLLIESSPIQTVSNPDGTVTATTTAKLQFPSSESLRTKWENSVECLIYQKGFEFGIDRISTIFAQEHPTENIYFNKSGDTIWNLTCRADGFPDPKIEIQKIDPSTGAPIGQAIEATSLRGSGSGIYICRAANIVNYRTFVKRPPKVIIIHRGSYSRNVAGKMDGMSFGMALYASLVILLLTRG